MTIKIIPALARKASQTINPNQEVPTMSANRLPQFISLAALGVVITLSSINTADAAPPQDSAVEALPGDQLIPIENWQQAMAMLHTAGRYFNVSDQGSFVEGSKPGLTKKLKGTGKSADDFKLLFESFGDVLIANGEQIPSDVLAHATTYAAKFGCTVTDGESSPGCEDLYLRTKASFDELAKLAAPSDVTTNAIHAADFAEGWHDSRTNFSAWMIVVGAQMLLATQLPEDAIPAAWNLKNPLIGKTVKVYEEGTGTKDGKVTGVTSDGFEVDGVPYPYATLEQDDGKVGLIFGKAPEGDMSSGARAKKAKAKGKDAIDGRKFVDPAATGYDKKAHQDAEGMDGCVYDVDLPEPRCGVIGKATDKGGHGRR